LLNDQEEKIKTALVQGLTLLSQLGLIITEASSSQGKLWLTPYYVSFRDHAIVLQSKIMDEKALDEYLELVP
jgi:hypothetical protein